MQIVKAGFISTGMILSVKYNRFADEPAHTFAEITLMTVQHFNITERKEGGSLCFQSLVEIIMEWNIRLCIIAVINMSR